MRDRDPILGLLGAIARCEESQQRYIEHLREHDPSDLERRRHYVEQALRLHEDARRAVATGFYVYVRALGDPDPAVRAEAVYTLVPLWERASETVPALWHLADGDADVQVRISALMGLEEMSGRERPDSAHLTTLLGAAHPEAVQVAAALVMVRVMGIDAPREAICRLWNARSDDALSMVGDSLRGVTPGRALHDLGTALNQFESPTTPEEIEGFLSAPSY